MGSFFFRLPQAIIRAFGISSLPSHKNFQIPINRDGLDSPIQDVIYELNNDLICAISRKNVSLFANIDKTFFINASPAIIESNVIHLYHMELKNISEINLIPYAASVFNPKITDITDLRGLIKCLKDSWYYKKLIPVAGVFDWASMILNDKNDRYIPWFWPSLKLDSNLYNKRLDQATSKLIQKSQLLELIKNKNNPILIQANLTEERNTFLKVLEYYYERSLKLRNLIDNNEVNIFIKPHRSNIKFWKNQKNDRFHGNDVYYPTNQYDFFIPTEILLNANKNSTLVSEVSSTLFNAFIPNKILIRNSSTERMLLDHGLMASRDPLFFKSKQL